MEIFILLLVIVLVLLTFYLANQLTYWRRRGIPHNAPDFLFGNAKGWPQIKQFKDIFEPVYTKYKSQGPFAGFYLLFRPIALATDIEFVKDILIKDFGYFEDRGMFHNEKDDPLTGNIFTIGGSKWRLLRQKLSSTFTPAKLKVMFPVVSEIGQRFVEVFGKKFDETQEDNFEITDLLARFTADAIGSCAFGLECNSLKNPNADFVIMGCKAHADHRHNEFIDSLIDTFPEAACKLRMRQQRQDIHDFYMKIVKDTIDYREKNNIKRNDFMNIMLNLKNGDAGFTFNEIAAQAFEFFVAGFDQSSTTMGFALYELARNPKIQEKLRDHINEILAKHNNEFTYECMMDMKYLEQVMLETLRKYPIFQQLIRRTKSLYKPRSNPKYYLEAGTLVMIPVYNIHHDPEFYPDPECFDPDRFSEEEIKKRHTCAWLPFGAGPRSCLGLRFGKMQFAIGLVYLLRNFKFSFSSKTPNALNFNKKNVILSPADGIQLNIKRINI